MFYAACLFLALPIVVCFWFLLPFALRKRAESRIRDYCQQHGILVLTFDDGPCPTTTPVVLDALARHNLTASFYALGHNLDRERAIVTAITNGGHDLANHSCLHRNAWKTIPGLDITDMRAGQAIITQAGGNGRMYRPPYGKVTLGGWLFMKARGITPCWWTIDPRDSLEQPLTQQQVIDKLRRDNGGVILLHDNDRYPAPDHQQYVLDLIDKCAETAKQAGLEIIPYSVLLQRMAQTGGKSA